MKTLQKKHYILIVSLAICAILLVVNIIIQRQSPTLPRDWQDIVESQLRVQLEYNQTDYYVVDADSMAGFQFELIRAFAQEHQIAYEIKAENNLKQSLSELEKGYTDLIIRPLATTEELQDRVIFTIPIQLNRHVLVQRSRGEGKSSGVIKNQLYLAGQEVHIPQQSTALLRLRNLMQEMSDTIEIIEHPDHGDLQLIAMVANSDIDYAVCEELTAQGELQNHPNIDIHIPIGFTQFQAWAARPTSPILVDSLNSWLLRFKATQQYQDIYNRYHR